MPILEVEIVVDDPGELDDGLATKIADAAAQVFQSAPNRVWVKLRTLPSSFYAENGAGLPLDVKPVFVSVLKADSLSQDDRTAEVKLLASSIAAASSRPVENVHVLYQPPAAGRIAFGGELVKQNRP